MNRSYGASFLLLAILPACNGQFDFDVNLLDAGDEHPIVVIDAGPEDSSAIADAPFEGSRPDVRIGCGSGTSCSMSGCCSTLEDQICVDIADGGTCSGVLIQCDDSEDCPQGLVCCAESDDHFGYDDSRSCNGTGCSIRDRPDRVHCEPEAHCRSLNYTILCNPDRPSPCAQCVASSVPGLPPGYHQCVATP